MSESSSSPRKDASKLWKLLSASDKATVAQGMQIAESMGTENMVAALDCRRYLVNRLHDEDKANKFPTSLNIDRNRCAWPADLKRFIRHSLRRVDCCEFSARLFAPLSLIWVAFSRISSQG